MKIYPYQTPEGVIELVEKREYDKLREELDWQNQRNSGTPTRGGYEFYINEEWLSGGTPSLMRERFDPDDERVRVRRTIEDDALLKEIDKLRAANAELIERLAEARESHLHASARDVQTIQKQAILLERLAEALTICHLQSKWLSNEDNYREPSFDPCEFAEEIKSQATSALAAYESANIEPVANPIDEAVRRMEEVTDGQIVQAYWSDGSWISNVRACLISAAKGGA